MLTCLKTRPSGTRRRKSPRAPRRRTTTRPTSADLAADLAWHVRAWGRRVLAEARQELAEFYPAYASWEPALPAKPKRVDYAWLRDWKKKHAADIAARGLRLCPLDAAGLMDAARLNEEFSAEYLASHENPRWVPKPTVAYLWARTVRNTQHHETTVPLLKTRWLCKKDNQRVLLTIEPKPDGTGAVFGIQDDVPKVGGNAAQLREHDKRIAAGTMSRAGVKCPVHGNIMTMEDIQFEGKYGRLDAMMTAVVIDGPHGKEYRLPEANENARAQEAQARGRKIFEKVPFGWLDEPILEDAKRNTWCVQYGCSRWSLLYTNRQLYTLGVFVTTVRKAVETLFGNYDSTWREAIAALLAITVDKLVDRSSKQCRWDQGYTKVHSSFARFALPILWDFCEGNPLSDTTGNYASAVEWVAMVGDKNLAAFDKTPAPHVLSESAKSYKASEPFDLILTDPPYYDAIGYSVLMDFFYVWLRRTLAGLTPEIDRAFTEPLSPKWNSENEDGELVDDASRHQGNKAKSKKAYEDGMAEVFRRCCDALQPEGRLVIVFANKQPDAWETLVSAIIRAGFVVDGSWPIQTEMQNRARALSSAALSSSVWLVCKKRPENVRPGWDNLVLDEMREHCHQAARFLGRRHPRAGLRLGGHRSRAGGLQQASRWSRRRTSPAS